MFLHSKAYIQTKACLVKNKNYIVQVVCPIVLFARETWTSTKANDKKLLYSRGKIYIGYLAQKILFNLWERQTNFEPKGVQWNGYSCNNKE